MEMKSFSIVVCLFAVLGQPVQGVSCPSCFHLSTKISGIPTLYKSIIESVFSKLNLANPGCVQGTVAPTICPASTIPGLLVNKCQTTEVTLKAKGLSIFTTAEMESTVWVKGCLSVIDGEADKCTALSDMDPAIKAQFTKQLEGVGRMWQSVSYSGKVCTTTP